MVQGIIIPADNTAHLTSATLNSLEDYRRVVGGWIEAVDIPDLRVSMYVSEEGIVRHLPFNRRGTFLWRFHVPQACDARLVGDIAVVGLTDDEGESTELPNDLRRKLLEPGIYRVRTRVVGESRWCEEPIDRDDYIETVIWATLPMEMSPALEVQIECIGYGDSEGKP